MREIITNKVYELRKLKNITQEDLAKHLGVTRQTIIAIEKGNYTPSLLLSIKIANFFKVKVEEVFKLIYEK
ncbi:helix-turn-helix transcriptional regulator [Candidatus Gottesmanbacteria bacterium]|nr:helix-turn-helix transcriptional regulator [Candidatus Gottesmanbacteria bacterium]